MARKQSIKKRVITFRHTDSSLTSKRVRIILSSPEDSKKLAKAVRAIRNSGKSSFKITKETQNKIEEESKKLETA